MSRHSYPTRVKTAHEDDSGYLYTVSYQATQVVTTCRCGKETVVAREDLSATTSATACYICGGRYWVDWVNGLLHIEEPRTGRIAE